MDNISANVGRLWQNGGCDIAALIGLCEHDDEEDEVANSMISSSVSLSEVDGGGVGSREEKLKFREGGRRDLRPDILLFCECFYSGPLREPSLLRGAHWK